LAQAGTKTYVMKVASIIKVKNRQQVTNWLITLPWWLEIEEMKHVIACAKRSTYVMWSQKLGFTFW
jgi:hypothetical protein